MGLLKSSVEKVIDSMETTGRLPFYDQTHQVNFNHGSPGAIPLLSESMVMFPRLQPPLQMTFTKDDNHQDGDTLRQEVGIMRK